MTSIVDLRKMVRPLLKRHPNVALVGRTIVLKPVQHTLRAVFIDRSKDDREYHPKFIVDFLLPIKGRTARGWSERLIAKPMGTWNSSAPGDPERMLDKIEKEALPALYGIRTLDEVHEYGLRETPDSPLQNDDYTKMVVALARGNLSAARDVCDRVISRQSPSYHFLPWYYPALIAEDIAMLAAVLNRFEEDSINHLKLAHLWERTAFPIETRP